jgi:DNA primase
MNALIDNDPEDSRRREFRQQIDAAKARLPLPHLMELLDDGDHAHTSACCPFHFDEHPSFSVFETADGHWRWNCFAGCGSGDEIDYLLLREELTKAEAIAEYLRLADEFGEDKEP